MSSRVVIAALVLLGLLLSGCMAAPRASETPGRAARRPVRATDAAPSGGEQRAQAPSSASPALELGDHVTIVALGDSNTDAATLGAGHMWPEKLREKLASRFPATEFEMVNAGVRGRTSGDVLAAVDEECLAKDPAVVVLMIGTNDIPGDDNNDRQMPSEKSHRNLRAIVKRVLRADAGRTPADRPLLVLMQPLPACSLAVWKDGETTYPYYRAKDGDEDASNNLEDYKQFVTELAEEYGLPLVPVYDKTVALGYDGTQAGVSRLFTDGVHASAEEQTHIASWAFEVLGAQFK